MNAYNVGDAVVLGCRCRDSGGVLADPSSLTLTIVRPGTDADTVVAIGGLTRVSIGRYTYRYVIPEPGKFLWAYLAAGNLAGLGEGQFLVRTPSVG